MTSGLGTSQTTAPSCMVSSDCANSSCGHAKAVLALGPPSAGIANLLTPFSSQRQATSGADDRVEAKRDPGLLQKERYDIAAEVAQAKRRGKDLGRSVPLVRDCFISLARLLARSLAQAVVPGMLVMPLTNTTFSPFVALLRADSHSKPGAQTALVRKRCRVGHCARCSMQRKPTVVMWRTD